MDCVFCKIAAGEIKSKKIYEDEKTFAFLDINPATKGHTLVIPKKHYETITEMPNAEAGELFKTVAKISRIIEKKLRPEGLNIVQSNRTAAGQIINHVHVHIIPRYTDDGLNLTWTPSKTSEQELNEIKEVILK